MRTNLLSVVKELRQIASNKDLQAIVVLTVERNGNVSVVTYGETKEKCKFIGDWGQGLWLHAISLVPFATIFGWGNFGKSQTVEQAKKAYQRRIDAESQSP